MAAGFFGVEPVVTRERGGPIVVLGDMWQMTKQTAVALVDFPVKVFYTALQPRHRQAARHLRPDEHRRAPAGQRARSPRRTRSSAADKVASLFTVLGSVNLFVALFNFIPLLPLDGGHIAGALYEAAKRGLARLRRRPDPGMSTPRGCCRSPTSSERSS